MKPLTLALLTSLLCSSAPTHAQGARALSQSQTFLRVDGAYQKVLALCDALETPNVFVLGLPGADRRARLYQFGKAAGGSYAFQVYGVGRAEGAAGSTFYPLTPRDGRTYQTPFFLRQVNPGVLENPSAALTPTWASVQLPNVGGGRAVSCRYADNTRLMGFSSTRSVLVTESPSGELGYQTFDFSNAQNAQPVTGPGIARSSTPSLSLSSGAKQVTGTQEIFTFKNNGYTYTVTVSRLGQPAGARLRVVQGGRALTDEVLTGYVFSERR